MNIEFHYYVVYFLALRSGFTDRDAQILAHSSQFVDDNIISYTIRTHRGTYLMEPTQNYGFWNSAFPREVYIPFHFFPGNETTTKIRRADGKTSPFNTTPNSERVKALLVDALKTRDLYRVGIALHTYADSWAHQNFTGRQESWNRIDPKSPIPPIGHAQALGKPDDSNAQWEDSRFAGKFRTVANLHRFIGAARQIYKYLRTYNGNGYKDIDLVEVELRQLMEHGNDQSTSAPRIDDFIIHDTMMPYNRDLWFHEAVHFPYSEREEIMFRGYSKVLWLRNAILYRNKLIDGHPLPALEGFYDSHLYRWHEATQDHRRAAAKILSDLPFGNR